MAWVTVDDDGHVVAEYRRQLSAELNAGGRRVVEKPDDVDSRSSRFDGESWVASDSHPTGRRERLSPTDARRRAYEAEIETHEQHALAAKFMDWFVADPVRAAGMPPDLLDEIRAMGERRASIRKRHPK